MNSKTFFVWFGRKVLPTGVMHLQPFASLRTKLISSGFEEIASQFYTGDKMPVLEDAFGFQIRFSEDTSPIRIYPEDFLIILQHLKRLIDNDALIGRLRELESHRTRIYAQAYDVKNLIRTYFPGP